MRILVTGHSGYIGAFLTEHLRHLGHLPIRCDSRFDNNTDADLYQIYGKPDKLIHCAWAGLPNYESIDHYNNVEPQYRFIKNLVDSGLKDVTVLGSCLETLEKQCHYALAKRALRQKLEGLDINLKWPQLFYLYGGNDKSYKLLPQIKKAINNGQKTFSVINGERDFIHVKTAVADIANVALQTEVTGKIEIGTGKAMPVIDFVKRYFHEIEFVEDYPIPDYEPFSFCSNLDKLNSI